MSERAERGKLEAQATEKQMRLAREFINVAAKQGASVSEFLGALDRARVIALGSATIRAIGALEDSGSW